MAKIVLNDDKFQFVEDDGNVTDCVVWNEKSKANDKHPEGKPWIKLPKGNSTNRAYYSLDAFNANAVDGEVEVEVKTAAPRVLGTSGVKQSIVKYLDEDSAREYTDLVNGAVEAFKAAKGNNKAKKPEEMTVEELEAYIEALKNGTSIKAIANGPKSFMDMFSEEEYQRYNELLALAQENKANAPRAKRGPLSDEEKAVRREKAKAKKISKAEELLAMLKAGKSVNNDDEDIIDEDELLDD